MLYRNNSAGAITAMEDMRLGELEEPEMVFCPVCGEEAEYLYEFSVDGEVVGCDQCITRRSAYDN